MRHQEINVPARIHCPAFPYRVSRPSLIRLRSQTIRRFHLHSQQSPAGIDNKVIALAVSPRLGHTKPKLSRLIKERSLRSLSSPLCITKPFSSQRVPRPCVSRFWRHKAGTLTLNFTPIFISFTRLSPHFHPINAKKARTCPRLRNYLIDIEYQIVIANCDTLTKFISGL